jgi:3-hydroxyacyl-CoA dehydrogenase
LKLFEIIPTSSIDPEVLDFLGDYARRYLGKTTVHAKDTPAFIANRIGTFSIMHLFNNVKKYGLNISEIDRLTGTLIGRASSATFRTADIVGLDTLVHVANGIRDNSKDEANDTFKIPDYLQKLLDNGWLGSKTGQGFSKKDEVDGKKVFPTLDFETMQYTLDPKPSFSVMEKTKGKGLKEVLQILISDQGKVGDFMRDNFYALFWYSSNRIPEISNDIYKVDDALNAGFGWKFGPFESWDAVGVENTIKAMEDAGRKPAQWVYDMLGSGAKAFYKVEAGKRKYYDITSKSYKIIPGSESLILLDALRETNVLYTNDEASVFDIGDGVLNVEFHSKMNVIGAGTLQALNKAIDLAEEKYKAVIVSNEADHFSAGANVGMIFMMASEQDWDELNFAVQMFQNTMMRLRYSAIPVIACPHGMTLGGGCELSMHSDKVIANAETYMGLVEFGVGLIPGGGGTKEFVLRLGDELKEGDIRSNAYLNRFLTIGQAKVSTSAYEAFDLGYLRPGIDEVIVSQVDQLVYAKKVALQMVEKGYSQPAPRTDVKVLGKEVHGLFLVGADSFTKAGYMSDHDKLIAEKLGYVMSGGDISQAMTEVSEKYLLELERKAFIELCMTRKTMERMQSLVSGGKILRN